jgi:glucose-1-phosphatase
VQNKRVPSEPKALIFDLGGVIVPLDFPRAYRRWAGLCGIPVEEIPLRIRATGLVPKFESGQMEAGPFADQLLAALGIEKSYDQFCELFSEILLPGPILPESLFRSLADRYRLVLLSNTNVIHWELLHRQYPLLDLFHSHVLSYRVGAMKPSPAIYQAAIKQAGCRAEECFFTDDVLPYVEGARSQGIDAVQFLGPAQLAEELQLRGVTCQTVL